MYERAHIVRAAQMQFARRHHHAHAHHLRLEFSGQIHHAVKRAAIFGKIIHNQNPLPWGNGAAF